MKLAYKCDGYNNLEEVKTKIVLDNRKKDTKHLRRKGDTMTMEKALTEAGWNFDNSYARLPEAFLLASIQPLYAHRS